IPPLQKRISDLILETNRQKNICDLSIILPIYNMQKYIEKYLNFLLNMQDINYELIVIDDFSEDLSLELLLKQELQNVDRLKVYQNFNKNGLYGAIKTGLKLAVGKYVLILDSDIVIYPDKLKSNLKLLKHNEEKKILFTSSDFATKTEII
ncbi:glycosyltransferase family 2 protein, partial [Campylobacter coli]|nr:glycosyltransferase family 2 protein [Campylobacter coli]